jgi:hypothetical protein
MDAVLASQAIEHAPFIQVSRKHACMMIMMGLCRENRKGLRKLGMVEIGCVV